MTTLTYEITVVGAADKTRLTQMGCEVVQQTKETTLLRTHIPDQTALHGIIGYFRDYNIPLISLNLIRQNNP